MRKENDIHKMIIRKEWKNSYNLLTRKKFVVLTIIICEAIQKMFGEFISLENLLNCNQWHQ